MVLRSVLAFLLLSLPALAQTRPFPTGPVRCSKEADCLSKLKGLAQRIGDALTLKLENGQSTTIRENRRACGTEDDDKCLVQTLRAYLPAAKVFVVHWTETEDEGAAVINAKTGQSLGLGSLPEFSPDGRTFVSVDADEMNGREYDVAIWSVADGTPKEVLRYQATSDTDSFESWAFVGWDGDNRIKLKVSLVGTGEMQVRETDAVRTDRGWVLNWPKAPAQ